MDSTQSPAGQEPPLINTRKLQTFVILGVDDYVEMFGDLMREVPPQLDRMRSAIEGGDLAECRQCAHSLRGILGYFGCVAMTVRLAELENRESVMPEEASAIHGEFQTLWHDSRVAIREWGKSIPDFAGIEVNPSPQATP